MKGKHRIVVENKRLHYDFDIKRNITIIKGNSATGKTTLIELLQNYQIYGENSGVKVLSDCPIRVINDYSWKIEIKTNSNTIFFVDEGNHFVLTKEFAETVKNADAYFVLILRDSLANLPYSIEEIYGMRTSNHYAGLKKTYNELYPLYGKYSFEENSQNRLLITEDSNSGFEFFSSICKIETISADGKSNIKRLLLENFNKEITVIADGAAFGAEMEAVIQAKLYEFICLNLLNGLFYHQSY